MKPVYVYLLAVAGILMSTFFLSQGSQTGLVAADNLGISIDGLKRSGSEAVLNWSTGREAVSVLSVEGERVAFQEAVRFGHVVSGLDPRAGYDFSIRACDASACVEEQSRIDAEPPDAALLLSGAVVAVQGAAGGLKPWAGYALFGIVGLMAVGLTGRMSYRRMAGSDPMQGLLKKAESHLSADEYPQANSFYSMARHVFAQLEEEAKEKHYDRLVSVYQSLKRYSAVKEAQELTEKYDKGTITKEELGRLGDLVSER